MLYVAEKSGCLRELLWSLLSTDFGFAQTEKAEADRHKDIVNALSSVISPSGLNLNQ